MTDLHIQPDPKPSHNQADAINELAAEYRRRLSAYGTTHPEYMHQNNGGDVMVYRLTLILAEIATKVTDMALKAEKPTKGDSKPPQSNQKGDT